MPAIDTPSSVSAPTASQTPDSSKRPSWLTPVIVLLVIAVAALAVVGIVFLVGGDSTPPEEVVTGYIDAINAGDLDAAQAALDPGVVISFDGTAVGIEAGAIPDVVGREAATESTEADVTVTYEVLSVEGDTVVMDETATFPDGMATGHTVTYVVSDDDLIVSIHHVIEE